MACGGGASAMRQRWTAGVFTVGDDTTPQFIPVSEPMRLAEVEQISASMEVVSRTSNLEVRPAVRFSFDGVTWLTEASLGTYESSTGWSYNELTSIEDAGGEYCQVGLQAKNVSATSDIAKGVVVLQVEVRRP